MWRADVHIIRALTPPNVSDGKDNSESCESVPTIACRWWRVDKLHIHTRAPHVQR